MKTKQIDYGARALPSQFTCKLNSLSIYDLSIHHFSHHHEHPAH